MKRTNALVLTLLLLPCAADAAGDLAATDQDSTTMILSASTLVGASQNLLAALGYEVGGWDGTLDERTAAAVRQFQGDQGLPVTGQVSGDLLVALTRALGAQLGSPHGEAADWESVARRIRETEPEGREARQERSAAAARLILKSRTQTSAAEEGRESPAVAEAIELLYANGVLVRLDPARNQAAVAGDPWQATARDLQIAIAQVLAEVCAANDEGNWITIVDSVTGATVAKYNPALGYRRYPR